MMILRWVAGLVCGSLLVACTRTNPDRVQGYVEGEFVYVASPLAGALQSLQVQRGGQVKVGDPLFMLDSTPEEAARDEAARRLAQARATLQDVQKGKRPSEIDAINAQLRQARAVLVLAEQEVRQLVVARNERRQRQGKKPLNVEREVEKQLRELENLGQ